MNAELLYDLDIGISWLWPGRKDGNNEWAGEYLQRNEDHKK